MFLRFVEDLDRKEVAGRLGISESQLGRRTRAALAKLRTELEEDGLRRATDGEDTAEAEPPPEEPAATEAPREAERPQRPAAAAHAAQPARRPR